MKPHSIQVVFLAVLNDVAPHQFERAGDWLEQPLSFYVDNSDAFEQLLDRVSTEIGLSQDLRGIARQRIRPHHRVGHDLANASHELPGESETEVQA